jgi:TRAP-type uncharacterized transport system substrate-binding protein
MRVGIYRTAKRGIRAVLAKRLAVLVVFVLAFSPSVFAVEQLAQATVRAAKTQVDKEKANQNTVTILASSTSSIYTNFVEDIFKVLDDRSKNDLRVLPVLSRGAVHNVFDILNLQGIDMGLTESIMIDHYKKLDPIKYANIEQRLQYITKLANTEFHIIAKRDITDLRDLRGKKVDFYVKESGTALVGQDLFNILGIAVEAVFSFGDEDLQRQLRNGEIAASARASTAPGPFLKAYKEEDNLHLLPIDSSLPGYDNLRNKYVPAILTHEQYPNLIPAGQSVPTIANATILAVYAWPENTDRYRKVANFVNRFFGSIDKFMLEPRHPRWREINLAAEVPGWTRFKAAQQWLDNNNSALKDVSSIRPAFEKFVQDHASKNQKAQLNPEQTEALVSEFMKWWEKQNMANPR